MNVEYSRFMSIKDIFKKANESGASDVHLVVGVPPVLRINGELTYLGDKNLSNGDLEEMTYSLLTKEDIVKFSADRDLDFGYEQEGQRFRVNIFFERNNIGLVARLINNKIPTLDEIGIPPVVYRLLDLKQGLILVTGPTGCGKSTTMAAMVEHINANRFCNIITLEDPIEYAFSSKKSIISQRQLGRDLKSFDAGLTHALRQDPNVIMVGEMRNLETIATTITLAETGHLVLATLHTYNASQTVDRIIDIFPPHQQNQVRMQLSLTLAGVISQRLIRQNDGSRIAAREVMINTPAVSNSIRENKVAQLKTIIETSSREGMVSIDQDIRRLYGDGKITKEIAQSYMDNPEMLEKNKK